MQDLTKWHAVLVRPAILTPAFLLVCWVASFIAPVAYLSIAALILGACILADRKWWKALALLVLLHPVCVFFVLGLAEYAAGSPRVLTSEEKRHEFADIDRDTRAFIAFPEDVAAGKGQVRPWVHNAAVHLATRLFGTAPGAYDGPYPSRSRTLIEYVSNVRVPLDAFLEDRVVFETEVVELVPGLGATILKGIEFAQPYYEDEPEKQRIKLDGNVFEGRCLIMRFRQDLNGRRSDLAVLFDVQNGRTIAIYPYGGAVGPRPPLAYSDPYYACAMARVVRTEGTGLLERFLNDGMEIEQRSVYGQTPIMEAAAAGREDLVAALLQRGANPNAVSEDGKTALMLAATPGISERLLAAGARAAAATADHAAATDSHSRAGG